MTERSSVLAAGLAQLRADVHQAVAAHEARQQPQCHARRWGVRCLRNAHHATPEHIGLTATNQVVRWSQEACGATHD